MSLERTRSFHPVAAALSRRDVDRRPPLPELVGLLGADTAEWSTGLIVIDTSGPTAADVPEAVLGDASALQSLREPSARLDLAPRPVLQRDVSRSWRRRLRGNAVPALATIGVHVAFAAAFFYLLSFRDALPSREMEIPVEVVARMPQPKSSEANGGGGAGDAKGLQAMEAARAPADAPKPDTPKPDEAKAKVPRPPAPDPLRQALAMPVAPEPRPAPPQPPAPRQETPAPRQATPEPPKLVAAPPEPMRAATEQHAPKPANLAPDADHVDSATREAKPAEVPRMLATTNQAGAFTVPMPSPVKPVPVTNPTPDIPAKTRSEADKLAAALPMDLNALPSSFRAVLSGNGAAVSAAYKGLVYGRFGRNPDIGERARAQHLKGQVIVAFSIDDDGRIKDLSVLQSSGNAAVDALGLELISSSAPFPPPPLEAQRSFTPALTFGE